MKIFPLEGQERSKYNKDKLVKDSQSQMTLD